MKKIALILVLFVSVNSLMADNGDLTPKKSNDATKSVVSGKVIDIITGESIAGACISIEGADIKVYTDLDGNYSISDVKPGTYTINVSMISYKSKEFNKVSFNPSSVLDKNVVLETAN